MNKILFGVGVSVCSAIAVLMSAKVVDASTDTKVVLITLDGVRHQEFFNGLDESIGSDYLPIPKDVLMPFVWKDLIQTRHAWVFGNREQGSICKANNPETISLPAYADILSGVHQSRVDGNRWNGQLEYPTITDRMLVAGVPESGIGVISSWKNIERVLTQSGGQPRFYAQNGRFPWDRESPWWSGARLDADTMKAVEKKIPDPSFNPQFLFISFDDTDEWAHKNKYANYLDAIHRGDSYIRRIFELVEAKPGYAGNTVYIITTDHGRGEGKLWKSHWDVPGSEYIWAVVYAPQVEQSPYALLSNCHHASIGQWMYELVTHRSFNAELASRDTGY